MAYHIFGNNPLELDDSSDLFGTLDKAKAIKEFLENCLNFSGTAEKVQMIALYGNWGSGKSSILKFLEKDLDKSKFVPVFFEAWKHEKDDNLALSLSDCIADKAPKTKNDEIKAVAKTFLKNTYRLFKAGMSGINIRIPVGVLNLLFKPADMIKSIEDSIEEDFENLSFYKQIKEFEKSFKNLENSILGKDNSKKIIVFVDDLDRCESEHVINILSAIKLFFTYGQRTVFFCAIDKQAVSNAINTKYKDIIKSEEYLEKIFDVSFSMPISSDLTKLLQKDFNVDNAEKISSFLNDINFTNPRHLKKVLNKYIILASFKYSPNVTQSLRDLIPEIYNNHDNQVGNLFGTILTLYIIILYEFYNDKFKEIEDYERKFQTYEVNAENLEDYRILSATLAQINLKLYDKITLTEYLSIFKNPDSKVQAITFFAPKFKANYSFKKFDKSFNTIIDSFISKFNDEEDKILVSFCKYLSKNINSFETEKKYKIFNLFTMAKNLL